MKLGNLLQGMAAAALLWTGTPALAQEFPTKPIQLIVPFGQGGATDQLARMIAPALEKRLGQPIVIINQPGAGGAVGLANLATTKPDGYTLGVGSDSTLAARPIMDGSSYTADSFATVARLVSIPSGLAVRADSKYQSLSELVEAMRNGASVNWSGSGIGSGPHLAMAVFLDKFNLKATYINSNSGGQAMVKLLSGEIDVFSGGGSNYPKMLNDKGKDKIRVLGLATENRWKYLPDVPTFREQGLDYLRSQWFGLVAPARTPKKAVDKIAAAVKATLDDPAFAKRLDRFYFDPAYLGPEEMRAAIVEESKAFRPILKAAGLAK